MRNNDVGGAFIVQSFCFFKIVSDNNDNTVGVGELELSRYNEIGVEIGDRRNGQFKVAQV